MRSSNAQIAGQTPSFDRNTAVNLGGGLLYPGAINPEGLAGQVFLAVDRSGGATNNNIYMLCSVLPAGRSTTDVMFVRSTDGGLSFSTPVRVNDDGLNNKWHWFGTFSVAPNGRLDAVWHDSRNAANNTDSQLFYSYSTDAGVTWSPNVAVSNPFNPFEGYPNQNKIGITSRSCQTTQAATWRIRPRLTLTRARGQHEEDVYYVRVFPSGGGTPTPTPTPSATSTPTATATSTATATATATATSTATATATATPTATSTATASSYRYSPAHADAKIWAICRGRARRRCPGRDSHLEVNSYGDGSTSHRSSGRREHWVRLRSNRRDQAYSVKIGWLRRRGRAVAGGAKY